MVVEVVVAAATIAVVIVIVLVVVVLYVSCIHEILHVHITLGWHVYFVFLYESNGNVT